jgi:hypothetical protein
MLYEVPVCFLGNLAAKRRQRGKALFPLHMALNVLWIIAAVPADPHDGDWEILDLARLAAKGLRHIIDG